MGNGRGEADWEGMMCNYCGPYSQGSGNGMASFQPAWKPIEEFSSAMDTRRQHGKGMCGTVENGQAQC